MWRCEKTRYIWRLSRTFDIRSTPTAADRYPLSTRAECVSLGGQGLKSRETKERAKVRRRMKDETDDHTDHGGGGSKQESDDNGVVAVIISGV